MPSDLLRVSVTLWLIALAVIDVRQRALPHALTTGPLLLIGGGFAIRALAPIIGMGVPNTGWDDMAVLLAFAAVLLSDTWLAALPALTALIVVFVLGTSMGQVIVIAWLLALAASQAGFMGAGDAKVIMVLLALYPDLRLGFALLAVTGVIGLALMIVTLRGATGLWLMSIARDLIALKFPARTGEAGQLNVPLVPLLAVGAAIYLWGVI